jgi:phage terminase large subunit-like protein
LTETQPLTDETAAYARDVVSGKIVAGENVRLACQRHLDDLEHGHERGLVFDVEAAQDAIEFFPAVLSITEGAKEGQPFELLPWHVFVVGSVFGWKGANGFIRFRFIWLETGKGQAKSPLMAAIAIYLQGFYGKKRAEVYCIGEVKDTAKVVFRDAVSMLRAPIPGKGGQTLEDSGFVIRGTGDLAYKIEHPPSESYMSPIANGDAVSGPKPIMVAGDEIHEMKSNKGIELWKAAVTKKHGDSIMMLGTNTPSIDQTVGTEYSDLCQKVMRGEFPDDSLFAYIARVDKDDDPLNDESCWIKALPALGITYPIDNIRKMVVTAKHQISTQSMLKRLYFGIPIGSAGFWTSETAWEQSKGVVDEIEMTGRPCHLSLDLSQKNDLTAVSACWEGEQLAVKTWYWTREFEVEARSTLDHIPYRDLEADGKLTITPGRVIDYSFVAKQIIDLCASQNVVQMAIDSAHMEYLLREFSSQNFLYWVYEGPESESNGGLKIVRHKQGKNVAFVNKKDDADSAEQFLYMPKSITQLEDKMLNGEVIIDDNKLTTICASNTVIDADAMNNRMFDKNRSRGRIDGMVTIAMAVGSASSAMEAPIHQTPWDADPNYRMSF